VQAEKRNERNITVETARKTLRTLIKILFTPETDFLIYESKELFTNKVKFFRKQMLQK